jgi:hypothetical protein
VKKILLSQVAAIVNAPSGQMAHSQALVRWTRRWEEGKMKMPRNSRNSALVSIREPHLKNVIPDTYEDEKAQTPTLSIEALRTVGDLVRAIKARISAADGHQDNTAIRVPLDSGSTAVTSPVDGEDSHRAKKEKR